VKRDVSETGDGRADWFRHREVVHTAAVEQRIGSSSQPLKGEPVKGAGFDPAFIPGITAPSTTAAEPEDTKPEQPEDTKPEQPVDVKPAEDATAEEKPKADAAPKTAEAPTADEAPESSDAEEPSPEGPVFEASDRRAKIVADHRGVRLSLDEEACEFRWTEIAAVETESARFGKRFTVTVHTPDRRWYPIEIEAAARARFKEWEDQLDAVLDAYFEEA
jgi:outer membrane biosynthesis protein TonB